MKVSNASVKKFCNCFINSANQVTAYNYFDSQPEAEAHAARTVSSNKGGEVVTYEAVSITRLPVPAVEVEKIATSQEEKKG